MTNTTEAKLPITAEFNTGRLYTKAGQRIAVRLLRWMPHDYAGFVALVDADRGIQDTYTVLGWSEAEAVSQKAVMAAYDHGTRAMQDDHGLSWAELDEVYSDLREAAFNVPALTN